MNTDLTRTAGTLTIGEVVNDDQSFDRLKIQQLNPPSMCNENGLQLTEQHVTFLATSDRSGALVVRCWPTAARVTVVSP